MSSPLLLEQYVKKILAAPVYDLAVRTPLQAAPALSAIRSCSSVKICSRRSPSRSVAPTTNWCN